uniref:Zinc knuckle CX2CX4HX4C domain-containing protein n=1 Tax=Noccaea caerulescens TaxID=107243 RepID=A0A1J3K6K8_NOCCA
MQCFNEWAMAMERWMERSPVACLQFIPIWVQIRNLHVNHYRSQTVWDIGEVLGGGEENQSQPYVRVEVMFDVSKPLRKSKVIQLPDGEKANVNFYYKRIQKRCFNCQRLNHEKDVCPLLVRTRQERATGRGHRVAGERKEQEPIIKSSDPLFGVLSEDQVDVNPITGKLKINREVLEDLI